MPPHLAKPGSFLTNAAASSVFQAHAGIPEQPGSPPEKKKKSLNI